MSAPVRPSPLLPVWLQAYQRGAFLVKFCQSQLQAVQEQVKIVEADMVRPLDLND